MCCPYNLGQYSKLPPPEQKEMKIPSGEEIQRFLLQAKEEGMYELFLLELTTCLRRGESWLSDGRT